MDEKELQKDYILDCENKLSFLDKHLQNGNFKEIETIAHRLKGSGAMYGFDQISHIGNHMEIAAGDCDSKSISIEIKNLRGLISKIKTNSP